MNGSIYAIYFFNRRSGALEGILEDLENYLTDAELLLENGYRVAILEVTRNLGFFYA